MPSKKPLFSLGNGNYMANMACQGLFWRGEMIHRADVFLMFTYTSYILILMEAYDKN